VAWLLSLLKTQPKRLKNKRVETDCDSRSGYRESGSRKKFRISNLKFERPLDKDPRIRSKKMKKLMFAAVAAFCGTVMALESANVVG
jgi:hypothetical protein